MDNLVSCSIISLYSVAVLVFGQQAALAAADGPDIGQQSGAASPTQHGLVQSGGTSPAQHGLALSSGQVFPQRFSVLESHIFHTSCRIKPEEE
jgi:hypothetical protein